MLLSAFARVGFWSLLIVGSTILFPAVAHAQSAIAGQVTDSSGAVLPGVTVEASSAALIEGSRTAVTDGQGRYTVEALRPGIYKVTFTLPGFSTLIRDEIELPVNFTAPISVQMRVGGVEESITVSGQSPLVDVSRTVEQKILTREVLDSLPTGRNAWAIGMTLPGTTINIPDVGGMGGGQQAHLSMQGSIGDGHYEVDGLDISCGAGSSQCSYLDDGAYQEVSFAAVGGSAEITASGVTTNMIPKEGGNDFKGMGLALLSGGALYKTNYSDKLKESGLLTPPSLEEMWDYNYNIGGPIKQDRLWFFYSQRNWGLNNLFPETFNQPGIPRQGPILFSNHMGSYLLRLTGQASRNNKLTAMYNYLPRSRPRLSETSNFNVNAGDSADSMLYNNTIWPFIMQVKWTSTLSSRMLLETGFSYQHYNYEASYGELTKPGAVRKEDTVLGMRWNAGTGFNSFHPDDRHISAKFSYITGSHSIKTGYQFTWADTGSPRAVNGDLYQQYANGVPFQVTVFNTPITNIQSNNDADVNVFVQDQWTINRLTLNLGLRYDYLKDSVPAQSSPAGTFVPAREFPAIDNLPTLSDWSPRLGAAFDLFGNARTAIKGSIGRYLAWAGGATISNRANTLNFQSDARTWNDVNRDDIAQLSEIGPSRNSQFGLAASRNLQDPDLERAYNWLYAISLEHQLTSRMSIATGYYHRRYLNPLWTNNLLTTAADYTLINIPDPRGNGQTIPVYNLSRAKLGQVQNVDSHSSENNTIYHGYEFSLNARFGQGGILTTGFASGRHTSKTCQAGVSNPNVLRFCDHTEFDVPMLTNFKLAGSYPLPWGISAAAVIQSTPGAVRQINYIVTRAIVPTLTLSSVTVPLSEPGSSYYERLNQLDLRFSKTIRYRAVRIQPQVGIFNVTNTDKILVQTNVFGPNLGRIGKVLDGRLTKIGVQVDF